MRRGTSRRLIVSLAGLDSPAPSAGTVPEAMRRAWQGTFSRVQLADHVLFVQDVRQSWYNDEHGFADLIAFIRNYMSDNAIDQTVAIGFSMGATGAFVLDAILSFDRVIAIVPQALIGAAACPWDRRYIDAWARIGPLRHARITPLLRATGEYVLLLPIDIAEDVRHAAELSRSKAPLSTFCTRCGEHNVLYELRRKGLQDGLILSLIDGLRDLEEYGYRRLSKDTLAELDRILVDGVESAPLDEVGAFARRYPGLLPTCLHQALYDATISREVTPDDALTMAFPAHARQVCRPEDLRHYAAEGWFAFDKGFTWSEGVHHFIRFHVIDFMERRDVRVRLFFLPLVNERHPRQRVSFLVNGRALHDTTVQFKTASATRLEVLLPITEAHSQIHIVTPDCVSPARLGVGDDPRSIALSFNHMLFEAD